MTRKCTAVLLFACAAAGVLLLAPGRADNFAVQGGLTSAACLPSLVRTADVDDGVLVLRRLALDALPALGSTADAGRFSISLGACGFAPETVVSTWFYNSTAGAVSHGRLNHASGAGAGWQYQLLPVGAGHPQLNVGVSPALAASPIHWGVQVSNNTDPSYRVRYYRSSVTLMPGSSSYATYVLYHH